MSGIHEDYTPDSDVFDAEKAWTLRVPSLEQRRKTLA